MNIPAKMLRMIAQAALVLLLLPAALYAQAGAPALALPDMGDEVRPIQDRPVAAPLPELPDLPMPDRAPPLPASAEVAVPETAFRTEAQLDTQARPELGETFSEVAVGAWLWDGVSAGLSIFRPGSDPSYSLAFSHDSRDGFAYHDGGEGYSYRRTSLEGRVRGGESGSGRWALSAAFSDHADGLQGKSLDFYGINHRYLDASAQYRGPLGPLSFRSELSAANSALSLERGRGGDDEGTGVQELSLSPRVALEWQRGRLALGLSGEYAFLGLLGSPEWVDAEDRYAQRGQTDLNLLFEYSPSLSFAGSVGLAVSKDLPVLFPFSLKVSAGLGEWASVNLEGGLASSLVSLAGLWRQNPYMDIGPLPREDGRWFGTLTADLYPTPDLTLRLGSDWAMSLAGAGRPTFETPPEGSSRALYLYGSESYRTLDSSVELLGRMGQASLSLGWAASWLDLPVMGTAHRLRAAAEYRELRERYGASVGLVLPLDGGEFDLPKVDAGAFLRLSQGIRLIAEVYDTAAAFRYSEGRVFLEPYLATGFQAGLRVQFSL